MSGVRTPKNFDAAIVAFRCPHPYCSHSFRCTGEEYGNTGTLVCPECGTKTPVDLERLKELHRKQQKMLRLARARLRDLGV